MVGRNRLPPHALNQREVAPPPSHPIDDPRLSRHRQTAASPAASRAYSSSLLEDRIAIQHQEIQSLLVDNQRLAATHVALKQELSLTQQELRQLSAAAANVKAERDAEVREIYEKSLKMDAEVRAIDAMRSELAQVRADVHKLGLARKDLTAQLQAINDDLAKAKPNSQQVPSVRAEIESVRQEIQRGRAAVEYEKKTHASNLEQSQAMEKNMVAMTHEIEKLRAELANAEKRARAAAAAAAAANPSPGFATSYGNPETGYGGSPYPDPYGVHQVQGSAAQYTPGVMPQDPYDLQRSHVPR